MGTSVLPSGDEAWPDPRDIGPCGHRLGSSRSFLWRHAKRQVVLVGFDGMQLLNLVGPAEMLDAATQVLGDGRGYRVVIATADGKPVRGSAGMRLAADRSLGHIRPRTVDTLIAGGGMRIGEVVDDPRLTSGLRAHLRRRAPDLLGMHRRLPARGRRAPRRQGRDHALGILRRARPPPSRASAWSPTASSFATVQS